ncbi:MAG: EscU/YscU/HrcU family type III secretion system export apparatus switch protein [Aquabacterium sp.]|nr:EscU/YscU/HrcU family type III secretion system export apparatus switch protein [Aquabacterium sp.]
MAEQGGEERSLEPSARKLEKAREDGRFPQSRDLSFLLMLLTVALLVPLAGPRMVQVTRLMITEALHWSAQDAPMAHLARWAGGPLVDFGLWLGGLLVLVLLVGALGPLALARFQLVFAFKVDFARLDPVAGLGRMVSGRNLFALAKGVVVTLLVLGVGTAYFLLQRDGLMLSPGAAVAAAVARMLGVLGQGLLWLMAVVLVVAAVDAAFQWLSFRREMRMTLQEMKDESKESEGSPEMRARIRNMQRNVSRRRMMAAVEQADVVVVNPTHYAVALRYDTDRMDAPMVIAKGTDEVALRIRAVAGSCDIPIAESPALARWLSAHVELGAPVPAGIYGVVAQLLAWAYAIRTGTDRQVRLPALDDDLPAAP